MSKISINSDIFMKGLKIYSVNGDIYAEITGEALTDVGPASFNVQKVKLDFKSPGQTELGAYAFMDGRGRVGYDFNLGDVLYKTSEEEQKKDSDTVDNSEKNDNAENNKPVTE